jgi:hypothetical protein
MKINNYSLLCFFVFICFSIAFRFLLPFGNEPDYRIRAWRFVGHEQDFFSIYYFLRGLIDNLEVSQSCHINSGMMTMFSSIDPKSCLQSFDQSILRLTIGYIVILPVFLTLILRDSIKSNNKIIYDLKVDSLSLSFCFFSFIYYFGVIGWEQLLLIVSICSVFIFERKALFLPIMMYILMIDTGDGIIVLFSALLLYLNLFIYNRFELKHVIITNILLCLFAFLTGITMVELVGQLPYFDVHASSVISATSDSYVANKYPIILRPIITYMTMVFMLPSGVKSIAAYAIVFVFFIYFVFNKKIHKRKPTVGWVYLIVFVTTILVFIFVLPGYANAKYYIYLIPFLIYFILERVNKYNALYFVIILNFIVVIELSLSYIRY